MYYIFPILKLHIFAKREEYHSGLNQYYGKMQHLLHLRSFELNSQDYGHSNLGFPLKLQTGQYHASTLTELRKASGTSAEG